MRYANDFGNEIYIYIYFWKLIICAFGCATNCQSDALCFSWRWRGSLVAWRNRAATLQIRPISWSENFKESNGWRFTLSEWNFQMQGSSVNIDPAKWSCNFELQKTPEKAWDSICKNIIQAFGRLSNPCFFRPQDDPCRLKTFVFSRFGNIKPYCPESMSTPLSHWEHLGTEWMNPRVWFLVMISKIFFFKYHPDPWGFMIPLWWLTSICFKWVGEKPPTRQLRVGTFGPLPTHGNMKVFIFQPSKYGGEITND